MDEHLEIGSVVASGQYRIRKRIGEGGMGVMYLAEQLGLERLVALKVVRSLSSANDEALLERFKREARALGQLRHENIVTVYAAGELESGRPFLAMEYIEGTTLSEAIAAGPMPWARAVEIARQIARGLDEAHRQGLVHRDLKPANVMLTRSGQVKVLDFGIVKHLAAPVHLTQPGSFFGTPQYMAPEQARGQAVDGRTDLYALGLVLYELLTGTQPFHGETPFALIEQQLMSKPAPPSSHRPELPRWLDAVVLCCLEKDPSRRYVDAEQLILALDERPAPKTVGTLEPVDVPRPTPARARWWPDFSRAPAQFVAIAVVLFLVIPIALNGSAIMSSLNGASDALRGDAPMLTFSGSNQGWIVNVSLQTPVTQLSYRIGENGPWNDAGSGPSVDVRTGKPMAATWFMLPSSQRATTLYIAWVDQNGKKSEAYPVTFEPDRERVAGARRLIDQFWTGWVQFRDFGGKRLVYFTTLIVYRCGFKAIHYGLDGAPATTKFEVSPCSSTDGVASPIRSGDTVYIEVPLSTRSITVEITYPDGTHSQPRTFEAPGG